MEKYDKENINNKVHWGVIIENAGCIMGKKTRAVKSFLQYNEQYS